MSVRSATQRDVWGGNTATERFDEDPRYLREQLITYLGNKRSLLKPLATAICLIKKRLGKEKLRILDAFAGSGVVSRFFKQHASLLISNDFEEYAKVVAECYLTNYSSIDLVELREHHRRVLAAAKRLPVRDGFVRRLYAPKRDNAIEPGERVFYTSENAMRIDSLRREIASVPSEYQKFLLAPLLSEASVHANTSGVFKGFYKNGDGVGQFGGRRRDALTRILGKIDLPMPLFSRFECEVEVHRADANELVKQVRGLSVAYFDPPYNQHPYGSNYFMLNLIVRNEAPDRVSSVSGIPEDWQRSAYNKRPTALCALTELIENTDATHLLISYNSEGFITRKELDALLSRYGRVQVMETVYNTFRGSRNLRARSVHVREHLFLLERR
jgi:adenine-specific DNA-methyltransferase